MTPDWICKRCGQVMFLIEYVESDEWIEPSHAKCTHCGKWREV